MKKTNFKEWISRLMLLFLGLVIAHLGVTMFIVPGLGTDCFTVFLQGVAHQTNISVGTSFFVVVGIITVIILITTKGYIKTGSIVCAVFGGFIIDFFTWINHGVISASSHIAVRVVVMLMGLVILSLGMSLVIKSDAGTGPNDLVAIILSDKIKAIKFRWIRVMCDVTFTAVGFILGGVVGVGTVVAAFLIGPTVQFFLPKSEAFVNKVLGIGLVPTSDATVESLDTH